MKFWQHYVDFGGRANRRDYWLFVLDNFILYAVFELIFTVLASAGGETLPLEYLNTSTSRLGTATWIYVGIVGLYALATLVPGFAIVFRRLRDAGHSPWWLWMLFVPIVGWILILIFLIQPSKPVGVQGHTSKVSY
ncbi:MAG: DUF805 domain-containing protein [Firmicutes bacterium]|nr:DUF805 domain-containing protein [Bacillota bacterium]